MKNLQTLDSFIEDKYGMPGSKSRDKFETGYKEFIAGEVIRTARKDKGLTQQELANLCGISKSHISRIENNIKDVRLSTIKKIVNDGLGGTLELKIQFD